MKLHHQFVRADGADINVASAGEGRPVLLLHGFPDTHDVWRKQFKPLVEAGYRVIAPDLRGYGRSTSPQPRPDHSQASKREMAQDVRALMSELGHEEFVVVGHDRGGYVAFRLAMDHPSAVTRLVLLDCVPIGEALTRTDARFAQAWWHWSSSLSLASPSGPFWPTRTPGTAQDRSSKRGWAARTTRTGATPSTSPPSSPPCSRTTGPVWARADCTTRPTVPRVGE